MGTDALAIPDNQATMNLGSADTGSALHEFGHLLGLIHETQNPNSPIIWNKAVVTAALSGPPNFWSEAQIAHNLYQKADKADVGEYKPFDPYSIMAYEFAKEWTNGVEVGNKTGKLSESDKAFIARIYPKPS